MPNAAGRQNFNDVNDYAGYSTAGGMVDIQGAPVAGLGAYNVASVTVTPVSLNDVGGTLTAVAETLRVTVTVSGPNGVSISLDGYRSRYAAP